MRRRLSAYVAMLIIVCGMWAGEARALSLSREAKACVVFTMPVIAPSICPIRLNPCVDGREDGCKLRMGGMIDDRASYIPSLVGPQNLAGDNKVSDALARRDNQAMLGSISEVSHGREVVSRIANVSGGLNKPSAPPFVDQLQNNFGTFRHAAQSNLLYPQDRALGMYESVMAETRNVSSPLPLSCCIPGVDRRSSGGGQREKAADGLNPTEPKRLSSDIGLRFGSIGSARLLDKIAGTLAVFLGLFVAVLGTVKTDLGVSDRAQRRGIALAASGSVLFIAGLIVLKSFQ